MVIGVVVLCLGAYLLGSINAALIVARSRGVDIRAVGSGNPGASNVFRILGKGPAAVVYAADFIKGLLPSLIGVWTSDPATAALAGSCAVLGHCYPALHRFKGGKGVATALGMTLALSPAVMLLMLLMYTVCLAITRISAVGSLAAVAVAVPALLVSSADAWTVGWFAVAMALIVFRHRSNLARLRSGAEHKLVR